ncbi:hypothetical protein [Acinetobacter seifertii]|uniref:hypothetical protein n=1 Tax=Acinetobacter seifertii TaxID=1530123 RepID=UPI0027DCF9D0|nr:hypothetical protein [Acinetobacter seifertii]
MEMHQFCYDRDIRIVLCNLKDSLFPFHRHTHIPDLVYCSKGAIQVELPDLQQKYIVNQGEFFQIPPMLDTDLQIKILRLKAVISFFKLENLVLNFLKTLKK